jgi:prepilin signal peptidase PulO-like enzyme (type II secretory pathway)
MAEFLLFFLGLALGSFLHVLASRYDPKRFILTRETLGGRSYCLGCEKTLAWYELIPLLSFLIQRGSCRSCGAKISWSYFFVELASGLIVVLVPLAALAMGAAPVLAALWAVTFLILLLITLIDLRLQIIPDELNILLVALGLGMIFLVGPTASWVTNLAAAFGAALFFVLLIAITRGRGMGVGDAKFVFALGLLFGWPDTLLLIMLAFIIGAVVGLALIAAKSKNMKSALPFGPFLAFSAAMVFFFGQSIIDGYLRLLGA